MPEKKKILVIDDDTYTCNLLKNYLNQNGYDAVSAYSGSAAQKELKNNLYDMVLSDFRLPDSDGLKILKATKSRSPSTAVVIITAYAEIKMAVELIKAGAFDYITKPLQHEEVLQVVKNGLDSRVKSTQAKSLGRDFVIGSSDSIKEIMHHVEVVAPTEMTVLIEGETGSGKEYIARGIHEKSKRSSKPFIAVDCGAIPRELANSELFGHIKGAFTGAINDKKGFFEEANQGTLFLDEVGNLPHENQVKLLRALQERVISRVGDNKKRKIDIRIIAASNDPLFKRVEENNFREDLYHRLNGFKINLPPLRERKEDIMEFVNFFMQKANKTFDKKVNMLSDDVKESFLNYYWYGNIRELQNVINRMVLLAKGNIITSDQLPDEIRISFSESPGNNFSVKSKKGNLTDMKSATTSIEKDVIQNALIKTKNNKSKAAKLLNIDRKTLYNKLKLYNIES